MKDNLMPHYEDEIVDILNPCIADCEQLANCSAGGMRYKQDILVVRDPN